MGKIAAIVSKNLKILMRSRVSALIIIFGPLFLTLFVGLAFSNSSLSSIKVGVYAPEYNDLVNSFLNKTVEAKLSVIEFNSEQTCSESIKHGTVNICMVFPAGFQVSKENASSPSNLITFYVDPSQLNLVYNVIDLITSQVESRKQELSSELTTIILTTLDNTKKKITADQPLFTDIAKSNEAIAKSEESIKEKLSGMDLEFNSNTFGSARLSDIQATLVKSMGTGNLSVRYRLNSSILIINSMLSDPTLNGTAIGTNLISIRSRLRTIDADIKNIDEGAIPDLALTIGDISRSLNATNQKFAQIKASRDTIVNSDLKDIADSVESILNKVITVKADLDSILREIDSIQVKETGSIVSPIRTEIKPLVSETYLNYMFPSLIALIVMLISLMFAQTVVMMERKSSAYFRNLVTPTKEQVFILSNFLTTLLLLVLQLLLILGISMIVFKVDILANFLPTLLALLIIATFFIIVGITVGTVFSSPETSTLGAISIGSICLFLSDVLLPLETMPGYIQNIAQFNPFVVAEHLLRSTIIFKVGLVAVFTEQYAQFKLPAIFIMLAYAIFMAIILLVSNEMIKRAAIQRKTMPKKAKKGAVDMEKAELGADPIERIETLIKTATDMIKGKEYVKANLVYVHLNEMYTNLPPEKKKEYFKKIEQIHQQLRKADQPKQ